MKFQYLETSQKEELITLFTKTFADSEGQESGKIIEKLVTDFLSKTSENKLRVFVAVDGEKLIGGICFTQLEFEQSDISTFMMAPVAVLTEYQGKGVGQQLINYGHQILKKEGAEWVITYGDINFYRKVGYQQVNEDVIPAPQTLQFPHGWLAQSLGEIPIQPIKGKSFCVDEIIDPVYW
jgi:predicted N-acetyltransferase YhbS